MANSALLTDGTTEYEFVYNPSTQNDFKLRYGMRVTAGEPDARWHQPDSAPPQLIRLVNKPVTIFLTTIVYGDDWDDIVNTLAPIKRWVDGDDQQAARYHTHGDVNEIFARIQLDGMTNYTDWSVMVGFVDDSSSYYTPPADLNKIALDVVVSLTCEPLGKGAPITLRNDCPSSPHFLEDSDSNGLADGYTSFGSPSTGLGHGKGLTGGQSQGITTGSTGAVGFNMTNYVTAATTDPYVAYVWLSVNNALNDTISITVQGASSTTLASKTFVPSNPTGYDKMIVGPDGNTWYRYSFSDDGSPARAAANLRLRIARESAFATRATTWYTDNLFIMVGTETVPDAWCSTSAIKNRYDPAATSAATEGQINYVDVWGVPGDSRALVNTSITCTAVTGAKDTVIASRWADGKTEASDIFHWLDSADMTWYYTSGSSSTPSDANRAGGSYVRHTADSSSVQQAYAQIDLGGSFTALKKFLTIPHRVLLLTRSSSALTTYIIDDQNYDYTTAGTAEKTPNAANTWELLDLGYVTELERAVSDFSQTTGGGYLRILVVPGATSSTVDIDAVLLVPMLESNWCILKGTNIASSAEYVTQFIGTLGLALGGRDTSIPSCAGSFWTIETGQKLTRNTFAMLTASTNVYTLTDAFTVSFTIYPRTRHLLGVS